MREVIECDECGTEFKANQKKDRLCPSCVKGKEKKAEKRDWKRTPIKTSSIL